MTHQILVEYYFGQLPWPVALQLLKIDGWRLDQAARMLGKVMRLPSYTPPPKRN